MLDAWISFLRHSPKGFPEGNLVSSILPATAEGNYVVKKRSFRHFKGCALKSGYPLYLA